jgi:hypothetical protein
VKPQQKQYDTPYDPVNKGVLFVNEEKKNEDSPDFTGSVNVAGTDWTLFGRKSTYVCKKTGKTKHMMKLSVVVPRDANKKPAAKPVSKTLTEDNWVDDDIDFQ